jgi:DNA-binding NtrC family response regulator
LENVIERGLVLAQGHEIKPEDLPEELRRLKPEPTLPPWPLTSSLTAKEPELDPESGSLLDDSPLIVGRRVLDAQKSEALDQESAAWTEAVIKLLPAGVSLTVALDALEEGLLRKALAQGDGVQSRAAEILGLKRNVFKYKWDKFVGLEVTPLSEAVALAAPEGLDLVTALEELEKKMLIKALTQCQGAMGRAADLLGLKKNLMAYKLKKYPNLS